MDGAVVSVFSSGRPLSVAITPLLKRHILTDEAWLKENGVDVKSIQALRNLLIRRSPPKAAMPEQPLRGYTPIGSFCPVPSDDGLSGEHRAMHTLIAFSHYPHDPMGSTWMPLGSRTGVSS